jgi:hypothetical protein
MHPHQKTVPVVHRWSFSVICRSYYVTITFCFSILGKWENVAIFVRNKSKPS